MATKFNARHGLSTGSPAVDVIDASGAVALASLGTGTPSSTTYLRGDGTWSALADYALDNAVVHLAGSETITGTKTFSANQIISVTDNTNAALTVTQSGTADGILVTGRVVSLGGAFRIYSDANRANSWWDSTGTTQAFNVGYNATTTESYIGTLVSAPLILNTNNTERIRIDATGNVTLQKASRGVVATDNDGSFDMNASSNFTCTPTGAFTLTFTNITSGQSGYVLLINTGGHAISSAATTKNNATFLTTVSTAGTYLISYFSDGTNVYVTTSGAMS